MPINCSNSNWVIINVRKVIPVKCGILLHFAANIVTIFIGQFMASKKAVHLTNLVTSGESGCSGDQKFHRPQFEQKYMMKNSMSAVNKGILDCLVMT
jgi:hypothetical protein